MSFSDDSPLFLQKGNIYAIPSIHYNMETAAQVRLAFDALKPDCVVVELPEPLSLQFLHAASRLPDISVIISSNQNQSPFYYLCEPCDAAFEGLRSAIENNVRAFCIDLDVEEYPSFHDLLPDAYAIHKIGLKNYYEIYRQMQSKLAKSPLDSKRELYMAKRLKELSFSYDRILFIGGMSHIDSILKQIDAMKFPDFEHAKRDHVQLCTLTEESTRENMAESGWISLHYEQSRQESANAPFPPDRQQLLYTLFKQAARVYEERTGNAFAGYHLRNLMKYARNYALISERLMPDLFQILACSKGCVDGNYAYETWELATTYSLRKNVDNLPELSLSPEEIWGHSKKIKFALKHASRKDLSFKRRPDKSQFKFLPQSAFGICSYPPEDLSIEKFGDFLKKKGKQILTEENARIVPFITSLEDGIDTRETIRHWLEKKLYVKAKGKPPGNASSVVIIFNEDTSDEGRRDFQEKYPWKITWIGEHTQESDMAFYATHMGENVVGPGISRCEYGGFMLSSPPRRLLNVWIDSDYEACRSKAEVLLVAAIDYATQPLVIYVAPKPPRSAIKSFAARYGKKVIFIPIGQLSPVLLNKIRVFHVLDGHDKRRIADEYIY